MNVKTYNRCEFIIRQFVSVEEPTEDLLARFHGWLLNGRHYREKNTVIRRLFLETLSDESAPARDHPNMDSASGNGFPEKLSAVLNQD